MGITEGIREEKGGMQKRETGRSEVGQQKRRGEGEWGGKNEKWAPSPNKFDKIKMFIMYVYILRQVLCQQHSLSIILSISRNKFLKLWHACRITLYSEMLEELTFSVLKILRYSIQKRDIHIEVIDFYSQCVMIKALQIRTGVFYNLNANTRN